MFIKVRYTKEERIRREISTGFPKTCRGVNATREPTKDRKVLDGQPGILWIDTGE